MYSHEAKFGVINLDSNPVDAQSTSWSLIILNKLLSPGHFKIKGTFSNLVF